jgi:Flp pilus assembly protein TadG
MSSMRTRGCGASRAAQRGRAWIWLEAVPIEACSTESDVLPMPLMPSCQRGVAMVEFSLIVPLFILLAFGIVEFGLILYDKAMITYASREAARAGIVLQSPKLTAAQISTVASNRLASSLVSFGGGATPSITVSPSTGGGNFGTSLTVNISYTYKGFLMGGALAALTGPLTIQSSTTMNNE